MSRPKLLDLFACEGGSGMGYSRAGLDVYGVDLFKSIKGGFSQKRYPFPSRKGDVIDVMLRLLDGAPVLFEREYEGNWFGQQLRLSDFAAIHASPPCQHASAGTRAMRSQGDDRHPALIEPTRELLQATDLPYVIENVKGAALRDPLMLCWSMFDSPETPWVRNEDGVPLRMERHRLFESNVRLTAPAECYHPAWVQVAGSYGAAQRTIEGAKKRRGGYVPSKAVQQRLLGVDWMTERGMHQCVPPAYTEHLGTQLIAHLTAQAAA